MTVLTVVISDSAEGSDQGVLNGDLLLLRSDAEGLDRRSVILDNSDSALTVWNGSAEVPVISMSIWSGSVEIPVIALSVWDGESEIPMA